MRSAVEIANNIRFVKGLTNKYIEVIKRKQVLKMSEAEFERELCKELRTAGLWVSQRIGKNGLPDRIATAKGLFFALEFKSKKGVQTDKQIKNQKAIENADSFYFLISPRNYGKALDLMANCIESVRDIL